MKFIHTIIVLSLLSLQAALCQDPLIDSLNEKLNHADSSEKFDLYIELGRACIPESPAKSLEYSGLARNMALQDKNTEDEAVANQEIGIAFYYLGDFDSAAYYYRKALNHYEESGNRTKAGNLWRNIGILHHKKGEYSEALNNYLKARELLENSEDTSGLSKALMSIGIAYSYMGMYEKNMEYLLRSLKLAEQMGDDRTIGDIMVNIGILYGRLENYDKALEYNLGAMKIFEKKGHTNGLANALNNLGVVYKKKGDLDSALHFYKRSMELKEEMGNKYGMVSTMYNIGKIYAQQGDRESAMQQFRQSLSISENEGYRTEIINNNLAIGNILKDQQRFGEALRYMNKALSLAEGEDIEILRDIYKSIAEIRHLMQQPEAAYQSQLKYIGLQDTLFNRETNRRLADLQLRYEAEKKEREIEMLKKEAEITQLEIERKNNRILWQRLLIFGFTAAAILIIIIAAILFRSYRLKQINRNNELERQKLAIEQRLLRSQMNPHFIFNSLNSIMSYITLNRNDEAEEYLSKFASLMRSILENSRLENITLKEEMEFLFLYLNLEQLRLNGKFNYEVKADPSLDPEATRIPPMLSQPFIENSIIHGMLNKEGKGHIRVSFRGEDGMLVCEIADDGIGREKAAELAKRRGKARNSLGIQVTRERLDVLRKGQQMEAGFTITDLYDEEGMPSGTRVTIKIPVMLDTVNKT